MRLGHRSVNVSAVLGSLLVLTLSQPVLGTYICIQHNLVDGIADTSYVGGVLTVSSPPGVNNPPVLNDYPDWPSGTITNTSVNLSTTFTSYDPIRDVATFTGGSYSLTFDYDGVTGYQFTGSILYMDALLQVYSSTFTFIGLEGLMSASTVNLPGSNDWPDGGGPSQFTSFTVFLEGLDMTGFNWSTDTFTHGESLYTLWPVPEPSTLGLTALAGLFLVVRWSVRAGAVRIPCSVLILQR